MADERVQRRLTAIMATDVVAYSRLIGSDEEGTLAAFKAHRRELIDPLVAEHHGRIVKTAGDGVLSEFASAVDAVRCAVGVQRGMTERNAGVAPDRRIELRIGINLGDIVIDGDDILGDGVNIAARLEGLAEPGGVLVSRAVRDQVRDRLELVFADLGELALKNISRPVRVYRVQPGAAPAKARPALTLPDKPSIAVLPFVNMSGDAEQDYFADGMVEEIITALSRMRWLFVIARNSSFTYKGRAVDVKQVGRELGVRYVLEGSVRKSGNRVRIMGQLIDTTTGGHLWADRFDGGLEDIFDLQDQVTSSVVGAIAPRLEEAEIERATRKQPQKLDAWECFVRGMSLYSQHSDTSTKEALEMLALATGLDQSYAKAHGLRAVCLVWRTYQGWEERDAIIAMAAEGANRAVAEDPQEPWAYIALGFVAMAEHRNADAVDAFSRAIDASPNFAYAYGLLGSAHSAAGRPDEAIECIDRGVRLSPRDIFGEEYQLYYAFAHFQAGRYAEAASAARRAIQERPGHPVLYIMAAASYGLAGAAEKARSAIARLTELVPSISAVDLEENFFYCQREDRRRLAAGLRAAGLTD